MRLDAKNPMMSALYSVLIFEVIVVWLAVAGMVQISDVPVGMASGWVGAVTLLLIVGCVGLRRGWGFPVAWIAQLGVVLLGLLTPWMFAMGIIFAVIWTTSFVLGKRIGAKRKEAR